MMAIFINKYIPIYNEKYFATLSAFSAFLENG